MVNTHTPVLLELAIKGLKVKKGGKYIDATVGEGGHLEKILLLGGKVLAIDLDNWQVKRLKKKHQDKQNLIFINNNFSHIEKIANKWSFSPVDGVLFDLGLSLEQITKSGRGFSYKKLEEPLDMRISKRFKTTAKDIVKSLSEENLYEIFSRYSEELYSRPIAQAIVRTRRITKIKKVKDLLRIIDKVVGRKDIKVYGRIFQALRIAVNNEIENLKQGLLGALRILKTDGRIVVISFHSVEDRVVKEFTKRNNLRLLTKKIMKKGKGAVFERSARLRIIGRH